MIFIFCDIDFFVFVYCGSFDYDPSNDGFDYDGDGLCDAGDTDDDKQGALDGDDTCI